MTAAEPSGGFHRPGGPEAGLRAEQPYNVADYRKLLGQRVP